MTNFKAGVMLCSLLSATAAFSICMAAEHTAAEHAATDPADWQRMHHEADQLQSGARPPGPTLAEVLGRRGIHL